MAEVLWTGAASATAPAVRSSWCAAPRVNPARGRTVKAGGPVHASAGPRASRPVAGPAEPALLPDRDPVQEDVELQARDAADEQAGRQEVGRQAGVDRPRADAEAGALDQQVVVTAGDRRGWRRSTPRSSPARRPAVGPCRRPHRRRAVPGRDRAGTCLIRTRVRLAVSARSTDAVLASASCGASVSSAADGSGACTRRRSPRTRGRRLAVAYDPFDAAAAEVAAQHGGIASTDPQVILDDDTIDAVVIASPTPTHVELLTRSVRAGKAVLCEKPIDLDLARVDACAAELDGRRGDGDGRVQPALRPVVPGGVEPGRRGRGRAAGAAVDREPRPRRRRRPPTSPSRAGCSGT